MKKLLIFFMVLMFVSSGISAQIVDPQMLDFSKAEVFPAGPDKVFLRSIYYAGTSLSLLLEYDGEAGAIIYGPYYEEDMILPDDVELGYVTFEVKDDDTITIANIILADELAVSGNATWDGGANLIIESFQETIPPKTLEEQIAGLKTDVASLKLSIAKAQREKADALAEAEKAKKALEVAVVKAKEAGVEIAVEREMPANTILLGFGKGKALTGSWNVTAGSLRQTDVEQKFAKFNIPVIQNKSRTLYSYTGKVTPGRWVGYGLHFFASENKINEFYGFGKSYLVWLTRDENYYKTDKTYLQVYESYNDFHMVQVASVAIPEHITSSLKIEILYDSSDGTIAVYINGISKIEYQVDRDLLTGDKVAFRSLGGGLEVTGFSVKTD